MNRTSTKRECGNCTACCTAIAVNEIGKPFNRACNHIGGMGCGIYGKHPDSCRGYQCGWLTGLGHPLLDRPDKLGAVFHASLSDGGLWVTVFFTREDVDLNKIMRLAKETLSLGPEIVGIRFVRYDQVMNADFEIDTKAYPGGENVGEGTSWLQYGDQPFLYLDAPRRIPLPVI